MGKGGCRFVCLNKRDYWGCPKGSKGVGGEVVSPVVIIRRDNVMVSTTFGPIPLYLAR